MAVSLRIIVNVYLRLLFSTALLQDYENHPPNPQQENVDAFLDDLTQPGGPVAVAFNYLLAGGYLPAAVVRLTLVELFSN